MPGDILAAAPSGVLPQTLSTAFTETRSLPVIANTYHDGERESGLITDGLNEPESLKTYKLTKSLDASDAIALRTFFEGQNGGLIPFYFYNPFEMTPGTEPGSNWDPTGVSIQGRHTVVFRTPSWTESTGLPFTGAGIEMAEVD